MLVYAIAIPLTKYQRITIPHSHSYLAAGTYNPRHTRLHFFQTIACRKPSVSYDKHSTVSISHEQIQHIAHLARIEFDDAEIASLQTDLEGILAFIETLNTLDTSDISPMTGGTTLTNIARSDASVDAAMHDASTALIAAAPEASANYIKVRSIFNA